MLTPWKKSYDQPRQHFKKQRHYFATKVRLVKAMVFPYGCESWTVKKAEHRSIDAFELWYWRRFLRVPWTARRSNQSILEEISPRCSLEGLMLKLKLQYFGHLMRRADSLEKPWCWEGLGAGGEGDHRGWDGWMASPTRWAWVWVNSKRWWWTGSPGVLQSRGRREADTTERRDWADWKRGGSMREGSHSLIRLCSCPHHSQEMQWENEVNRQFLVESWYLRMHLAAICGYIVSHRGRVKLFPSDLTV